MKIIFTDIDGIFNCENAYENGLDRDKYGELFYEPAKILFNSLVEKTDAKIVISSTWRFDGLEIMKEMWKERNMSGEIIGITPHIQFKNIVYSVPRGCEIDEYLRNMGFSHINWNKDWQKESMKKSGIENYIIIDDDSDMLYTQKNNFIHVFPSPRNKDGFCEKFYNEALEKLSKNIIELNY